MIERAGIFAHRAERASELEQTIARETSFDDAAARELEHALDEIGLGQRARELGCRSDLEDPTRSVTRHPYRSSRHGCAEFE
jgi:hypothetical protein